jgi:hypothetical protein
LHSANSISFLACPHTFRLNIIRCLSSNESLYLVVLHDFSAVHIVCKPPIFHFLFLLLRLSLSNYRLHNFLRFIYNLAQMLPSTFLLWRVDTPGCLYLNYIDLVVWFWWQRLLIQFNFWEYIQVLIFFNMSIRVDSVILIVRCRCHPDRL